MPSGRGTNARCFLIEAHLTRVHQFAAMEEAEKTKAHRKRLSGPKAEKKKAKKLGEKDDDRKNPKAFTFKSAVRAARAGRRKLDISAKRQRVPEVDRTPQEPPPVCVAVVGPPKVGKTTLIRDLVRNFTRQALTESRGPITVVSGEGEGLETA